MTAGSDRLTIDGATLETRWIGPRADQAPTIVMLHEGLGSAGLWGAFPDNLAAATGCGVFTYSRAGYGGSSSITPPRPLSYMHDEALQVLPKILTAIGFRRGILLGHSDGASIATIYTGGIQDHRIRGVSLLAPHFFVEDISIASIARARDLYEKGDLKEKLARHHGTNVDGAFWGWNKAWLDPAFRAWDIRDYVGYIRVPIQIVQGVDDQYGTTAQIDVAHEESYCPVDVTLVPGARHAPHIEQPDATLTAVSRFVATVMETMAEAEPLTLQKATNG